MVRWPRLAVLAVAKNEVARGLQLVDLVDPVRVVFVNDWGVERAPATGNQVRDPGDFVKLLRNAGRVRRFVPVILAPLLQKLQPTVPLNDSGSILRAVFERDVFWSFGKPFERPAFLRRKNQRMLRRVLFHPVADCYPVRSL
jgi:hypothetical protein